MVFRQAIRNGDKAKARVAGEVGLGISVEEETIVIEVREEHGNMEFVEAEELGKLEHRVHMALQGVREDENMWWEFLC